MLGSGRGPAGRSESVGNGAQSRKRGCTRAAPVRTWLDTLPEGELAEGLVRYFHFDLGPPGLF